MYEKVSTNLNFVDREKKIEKFWEMLYDEADMWGHR